MISYFQCRKPTLEEVQSDRNAIHIHLTSPAPWNPKDPGFSEVEDSLRATVAPVRGLDIGAPDDYDLSSLNTGPIKQVDLANDPTIDLRSVAAIGTIQEIDQLRSSCALAGYRQLLSCFI